MTDTLLEITISTSFPLPIAAPYRRSKIARQYARKVNELLYATEALLQLMGSAVLVDAAEQASESEALRSELDRTRLDPGATMGLWGHCIGCVAPNIPKPFFTELGDLVSCDDTWRDVIGLTTDFVGIRNSLAHPVVSLAEDHAKRVHDDLYPFFLRACSHFRFLSEYSLLGVTDCWEGGRTTHKLRYFPLSGYETLVEAENTDTTRNFNTADVLLLAPTGHRAMIMSPFYYLSDESADTLYAYRKHHPDGLELYNCVKPMSRMRKALGEIVRTEVSSLEKYLFRHSSNVDRPDRCVVFHSERENSQFQTRTLSTFELCKETQLDNLQFFRSGGMSEIYLGEDPVLNRKQIVKVLKSEVRREAKKRLEQEARLLAGIEHPGVIKVNRLVSMLQGDLALVEEYFEGLSLQEDIDANGPMPEVEVRLILEQILDALEALHEKGIIHRDIKPSNILYNRESRKIKLIDLGIAKDLNGQALTRSTHHLGTRDYMAPEQSIGKGVDPRTDIFSLGLTVLAILTGRTPSRSVTNEPEFKASELSERYRCVVEGCCEVHPDKRYSSISKVREALSRPPRPQKSPLLIIELDSVIDGKDESLNQSAEGTDVISSLLREQLLVLGQLLGLHVPENPKVCTEAHHAITHANSIIGFYADELHKDLASRRGDPSSLPSGSFSSRGEQSMVRAVKRALILAAGMDMEELRHEPVSRVYRLAALEASNCLLKEKLESQSPAKEIERTIVARLWHITDFKLEKTSALDGVYSKLENSYRHFFSRPGNWTLRDELTAPQLSDAAVFVAANALLGSITGKSEYDSALVTTFGPDLCNFTQLVLLKSPLPEMQKLVSVILYVTARRISPSLYLRWDDHE